MKSEYKSLERLTWLPLVAGLLFPVLILSGCPSGTNQQKAANAAANVASFLQQAQAAELEVFSSSQTCLQTAKTGCLVITPEEHVFIQEQFKAIAMADKSLDACIRLAKDAPGIASCADNAVATVEALNSQGALRLKSDKAKAIFTATIDAVRLGIQQVSTLLGGKK